MDSNFNINIEKTLNAALFILDRLGGSSDFHKLFKILYFADQKHLATYGTPISRDLYVAMKNGPVPSELYDKFKSIRDKHPLPPEFTASFEINNSYSVTAKRQPDVEALSESDVECLTLAIEENKNLSFHQLTQKSHKSAWDAADYDEMSVVDIAREGGADDEMLKYIRLNIENQRIFDNHAVLQ
jgi:Uncharacterized phage-associated protein